MNTMPSSTQPAEISVITPVYQAFDRVKRVLFQPFDLGRWFIIGFCAWLAQLGERAGGNFNFNGGGGNRRGGGNLHHQLEQARDFAVNNLSWIIPVAIFVVLLCLALWVLFTWLNSRGKFMFLHCVALNVAEVVVPWKKFEPTGNSLFWFRIVLGLVGMVLVLPVLAVCGFLGWAMVRQDQIKGALIAGLICSVLVLMVLGLVFLLIRKFTMDFVVPIMFLRGCTCREGWSILWALLTANLGQMLLYLLFQLVLAVVIGMAVLMFLLVTCCFCCLVLIPYIGTVILLPVMTFQRAYSAYYLAQYGSSFDVFTPAPASA